MDAAPLVAGTGALAPEMLARAHALRDAGFTIVHAEPWSFIGVQSRWHWDLGMHLTTILRVRRVEQASADELRAARQQLFALGHHWDSSNLPRGVQHGRAIADVVIADRADDQALAFARGPIGKAYGVGVHCALVSSSGQVVVGTPLWGRLFWGKTRHAIECVAKGQGSPAPISALGAIFAALIFYPSLAILSLMCCGLPLILGSVLVMTEKKHPSVLP